MPNKQDRGGGGVVGRIKSNTLQIYLYLFESELIFISFQVLLCWVKIKTTTPHPMLNNNTFLGSITTSDLHLNSPSEETLITPLGHSTTVMNPPQIWDNSDPEEQEGEVKMWTLATVSTLERPVLWMWVMVVPEAVLQVPTAHPKPR